MIDLVFNNFTTDKKFGKEFFNNVIAKAVTETGLGSEKIELSINLVGEGRIKALNKKYRSKNKVTDVLSFPLISGYRKTTGLAITKIGAKSIPGGIMSLGDIFICLPVAKKYTAREGVVLGSKLAFLTVHGFLHLLGYDHEKSAVGGGKMFSLQDKILKRVALGK